MSKSVELDGRRVVVGSDEATPLTAAVIDDLKRRGAKVSVVGPLANESSEWAAVSRDVGHRVVAGDADFGVLFCWTGTGASIAANKVEGVRAALCADAVTAAGARRYNDANVLVMSLRTASPAVAAEMLDAWTTTAADPSEAQNIASLDEAR